MKEKGLNIQQKVIQNMLRYLEHEVPIIHENNRMKDYVKYLAERTNLKPNRIKRILDDDVDKRLSLSECNEIAQALGMSMYALCSYDKQL